MTIFCPVSFFFSSLLTILEKVEITFQKFQARQNQTQMPVEEDDKIFKSAGTKAVSAGVPTRWFLNQEVAGVSQWFVKVFSLMEILQ